MNENENKNISSVYAAIAGVMLGFILFCYTGSALSPQTEAKKAQDLNDQARDHIKRAQDITEEVQRSDRESRQILKASREQTKDLRDLLIRSEEISRDSEADSREAIRLIEEISEILKKIESKK